MGQSFDASERFWSLVIDTHTHTAMQLEAQSHKGQTWLPQVSCGLGLGTHQRPGGASLSFRISACSLGEPLSRLAKSILEGNSSLQLQKRGLKNW